MLVGDTPPGDSLKPATQSKNKMSGESKTRRRLPGFAVADNEQCQPVSLRPNPCDDFRQSNVGQDRAWQNKLLAKLFFLNDKLG